MPYLAVLEPVQQSRSATSPQREQGSTITSPQREQGSTITSPQREQGSTFTSPQREQGSTFTSPQREQGSTFTSPQREQGSTIDVTVCIANWNCRELLRRCLASLQRQSQGVNVEIIVVDNASTDGAAVMTAMEFPEVRLIRNATNRGFSRANNQAASLARGRYLFFLNNDTVVPPETLGRLLEYLQAHPEVSVVGPLLRDARGKVQMSHRQRPTVGAWLHRTRLLRWTGLFRRQHRLYRRQRLETTGKAQEVEVLLGAALFMRRDQYRAMGGWDEDFHFGGEDLDFCLRAARQGKVVYLPSVEITHVGRVSTKLHAEFSCTAIQVGFAKYLRKSGCGFWGRFLYKLAVTLDTPLQLAVKSFQYLVRRWLGQRQAQESLTVLRGLWPFLLRGMWPFWRA